MEEAFSLILSKIGIPLGFLFLIIIWDLVWKLLAMWKSAKNNSIVWFIILAIFNTLGILPILYIYVFSKIKKKSDKKSSSRKKKRR